MKASHVSNVYFAVSDWHYYQEEMISGVPCSEHSNLWGPHLSLDWRFAFRSMRLTSIFLDWLFDTASPFRVQWYIISAIIYYFWATTFNKALFLLNRSCTTTFPVNLRLQILTTFFLMFTKISPHLLVMWCAACEVTHAGQCSSFNTALIPEITPVSTLSALWVATYCIIYLWEA